MTDASNGGRPRADDDPEATVMIPAGRGAPSADEDATVMIPAPAKAAPRAEPDPDATVMIPAGLARPPEPDADATVMMPAMAPRPVDDDATVMMPAAPAFDPEATIAIPTPGRRRAEAGPPAGVAPVSADPVQSDASGARAAFEGGALNPLVAAAHPILAVVAQIRHALRHPDPEGLRRALADRLEAFDREVAGAGLPEDSAAVARSTLRHLVDESLASTPWGARAGAAFLPEQAEAADPFDAMERLAERPAAHLALLEFQHVCLALGLEGRYREMPEGREKLREIRSRLRDLLRTQYPAPDGELSPQWRGLALPARREPGMLGFWAAGAGAGLFLALLYAGFSLSLGGASDPVARDLAQLRLPPPPVASAAPAAPPPGLAKLLAAEIEKGEIAVTESAGRATIVVRGDRLFASGSARLEPAVEPVLLRVATALDQVSGAVVVAGHTDDVPIRTARFPSNWELSAARAASVVRLMGTRLKDAARLSAEGMADAEPLAPNDSEANRARNRRVSIVLRSGA